MLLRITNKCNINCKHCFNDHNKNIIDMTWDIIVKSVAFINKMQSKVLVITGGEPTEHKDFINIIKYISQNTKEVKKIVITSNGVFFENNYDITKEILDFDKRISIQITNDIRYYPIKLNPRNPIYKLNNIVYCDRVDYIYPQGNALKNNLNWQSNASKCFNFISIVTQLNEKSLQKTISILESNFKFCTPEIDVDGSLKPGESNMCKSFGTIDDDEKILLQNILNFRCTQCDFINKKLPHQYRKLIHMEL